MKVYRLSRRQYKDDLLGKGAEIAGGRWNSIGIALLYTGESRALCATEVAVHIPYGITPLDYCIVTIEIPDISFEYIEEKELKKDWRTFPHQSYTKLYGDNFVKRNDHLVLRVPSAVIQREYNYLVNPKHKLFKKVKIIDSEPFIFDKRLFERN